MNDNGLLPFELLETANISRAKNVTMSAEFHHRTWDQPQSWLRARWRAGTGCLWALRYLRDRDVVEYAVADDAVFRDFLLNFDFAAPGMRQ